MKIVIKFLQKAELDKEDIENVSWGSTYLAKSQIKPNILDWIF
ncbi:MAG TPA: hypothetical protein VN828_24995 [Acidobacteriaceae bacterium]|nr:hypothetical protein [Acidobacteriaceae bacterium]